MRLRRSKKPTDPFLQPTAPARVGVLQIAFAHQILALIGTAVLCAFDLDGLPRTVEGWLTGLVQISILGLVVGAFQASDLRGSGRLEWGLRVWEPEPWRGAIWITLRKTVVSALCLIAIAACVLGLGYGATHFLMWRDGTL
ncbi:MAG: hypothetical protein AAF907_04975 [Planctomycetota bacterium]